NCLLCVLITRLEDPLCPHTTLFRSWVTMDMVPQIPVVHQKPQCVTYGPLSDTHTDPDVVLLRLNPKQVMIMHDAMPDMRMEGKPDRKSTRLNSSHVSNSYDVFCLEK